MASKRGAQGRNGKTRKATGKAAAKGMSKGAPKMAALQAWFGKAIARPLPDVYEGNPLAVSAPAIRKQAAERLWSRGGLSGFDRLGVYNQQYWFRLITIMQQEYPCAVHLLGLRRFNDWAVRYLDAHPPASPFLTFLDAEFPAFMAKRYRGKNRKQVLQAVAYERAFALAVDAPAGEPLRAVSPAEMMSVKIALAPHATPLELDWDFAAYRALCLQDESLEERFPLKRGKSFAIIYRDADHRMRQAAVSSPAYRVLREMRKPATLPQVFARLDGLLKKAEQSELVANLTAWFRDWTAMGWVVQNAMPASQRLRRDSK
jgi:hypothetical protein